MGEGVGGECEDGGGGVEGGWGFGEGEVGMVVSGGVLSWQGTWGGLEKGREGRVCTRGVGFWVGIS